MAAPLTPTARLLCTEGLRKAGQRNPSMPEIERARTEWLEEIKHDIVALGPALTDLQTEAVLITQQGVSAYAMPTDCLPHTFSMRVGDGSRRGLVQAGATNTVTVAATETLLSDLLGRRIAITSGTGKGSLSQITSVDNATKVVTVKPNFQTAPVGGDGYLFVESIDPLTHEPTYRYDRLNAPMDGDRPKTYTVTGDPDDGEVLFWPVPNAAYPVIQRYSLDLLRLDVDGTRMSTLYRRWRMAWVLGIAWRAADAEERDRLRADYRMALAAIRGQATYGNDVSTLTMRVEAYDA